MSRVHYNNGHGRSACGYSLRLSGELTAVPAKVTCGKCKQTFAFKEMLQP